MFLDSLCLDDLKSSLNLTSTNAVSQVPVSVFFKYFPILDPIWSSYKQLCMSSLSDSLVNKMTDRIQQLSSSDPLFKILSSSLHRFPTQHCELLREYESNNIVLSTAVHDFIETSFSPFWQSSIACFKYMNPMFTDLSGKPLSYPTYFHDPVILDAYNHSCLEVRGNFFYPPLGFREWHTNFRNPGLRAYCVFCDDTYPSSFNYFDSNTESTVIVQDRSDFCNVFEVPDPSLLAPYLWHSVSSQTWRISMGFRVVDQISDLDQLHIYIHHRSCIPSPFDWNVEWEWWIRLPIWNSKTDLSKFLGYLSQKQFSTAISFLNFLLDRYLSDLESVKDRELNSLRSYLLDLINC